MKHLIGLALVAALLSARADAQERSAALRAPGVRATTLVVENLERSMDFYQRLGMTKAYDKATTREESDGVIGAADFPLTEDPRRGRLVIMKGNDERIGMIGLLSYDNPPLASARSNVMGIGTGDVIVMFEVPDIQGAYTRLQQAGVRFHRTPHKYKSNAYDGTPTSGQRMLAYDPDGHLIEIAQPDR